MTPSTAQLFGGLALFFVGLECAACLGLTATISLTGMLGGLLSKRAAQESKEGKAPAPAALAPPSGAAAVESAPKCKPARPPPAIEISLHYKPDEQPATRSSEPSAPAPIPEPSAPAPAPKGLPPAPASEPSQPPPPSAEPSTSAPLSEASATPFPERSPRLPTSEPSVPGLPRSEPSAPSLGAQGSSLLPHEVSFTFCNALASGSSSEGSSDAASEGDGPHLLGAVDERDEEEGSVDSFGTADSAEVADSLLSEEEDCPGELVFEHSSTGVPGMRMLQHNISGLGKPGHEGGWAWGLVNVQAPLSPASRASAPPLTRNFTCSCLRVVFLSHPSCPGWQLALTNSPSCFPTLCAAERTAPTSATTGSPLLVSSYEARLVEIVNGRVKSHAEADPAYISQPLQAAVHSPRLSAGRRSPSRRKLGPLTSCSSFGSLSAGPSSSNL